MKKVDILLPCYNESLTLSKCIKRIKNVMDKEKYDYSIIVCDNNSSDKSRLIAKREKFRPCKQAQLEGRGFKSGRCR